MIKKWFYRLKPLIPRSVQLFLRRNIVRLSMKRYQGVWPIDERASTPPSGWPGWPGGKSFALILTHDVESAQGAERCHALASIEESLGFRSSFNFVPERYKVEPGLRQSLADRGFEVGVHGLCHDGKYFDSPEIWHERAIKINRYLKEWNAVGYRTPSMLHNLEWIGDLNIAYDASTFDTDPFEPQPDGVGTIFPFWVSGNNGSKGYVELPYTLPQDFTVFVLLQEQSIRIWNEKLDWIADKGGMALLNTHPDYMNFGSGGNGREEYSVRLYTQFLQYVSSRYADACWNDLPLVVARYCSQVLQTANSE